MLCWPVVVQILVVSVGFCRSLFILLSFFLAVALSLLLWFKWSLITPLVFSNFSYLFKTVIIQIRVQSSCHLISFSILQKCIPFEKENYSIYRIKEIDGEPCMYWQTIFTWKTFFVSNKNLWALVSYLSSFVCCSRVDR